MGFVGATGISHATDPTLSIHFSFSVPKQYRKIEGFNSSVDVPLLMHMVILALVFYSLPILYPYSTLKKN